jgi:hypothetical protein
MKVKTQVRAGQDSQPQDSTQQESREFTAVSDLMKTKHDTVKSSISNVR